MKLSKSFEDYLEAILIIKEKKESVRVKDIALHLKVRLPSVTEAVRKLAKINLVTYEKYGFINLTKKGEKLAEAVYEKHKTLFLFLTKILKVDEKTASEDACALEHSLSQSSFNKLNQFVKKQL